MSRAEQNVHDVFSGRVFQAGACLFLRDMSNMLAMYSIVLNILDMRNISDVTQTFFLHVHT